jgi:hypothetical protein
MCLGRTLKGLHYRRVAEAVRATLILGDGWAGSVRCNPSRRFEEELEFGFRLCVTREQKFSAVGGRYFHIDHLHGGKLLKR